MCLFLSFSLSIWNFGYFIEKEQTTFNRLWLVEVEHKVLWNKIFNLSLRLKGTLLLTDASLA